MSDSTGSAESVEAEAITSAVEAQLEKDQVDAGMSAAAKNVLAAQIYTTWRNANLRGLSQQAFAKIEAASSMLIADIAAKL